jgi:hypothetical protein
MINVTINKCHTKKCKNKAIYGIAFAIYCKQHKLPDMINIQLENKCSLCDKSYDIIVNNQKYCLSHCPDKNIEIILKRQCKYCDIEDSSTYICQDCQQLQNKKEWMVIRHLRRNIKTPFIYNSSYMLDCSLKRPDCYFELNKHCVIVEIDENQHKNYQCECARLNEIVNGIGGKSVIFIRFNPDKIKHKGKEIKVNTNERLDRLVDIIQKELYTDYDYFVVKLIQLYYDHDEENFEYMKSEDITDLVSV